MCGRKGGSCAARRTCSRSRLRLARNTTRSTSAVCRSSAAATSRPHSSRAPDVCRSHAAERSDTWLASESPASDGADSVNGRGRGGASARRFCNGFWSSCFASSRST